MTVPDAPVSTDPLINRERASDIMQQAGLDGIVVSSLPNVYYATGFASVLSRFRSTNANAAIIPADAAEPIALVAGAFEFYADMASTDLSTGVQLYLSGEAMPGGDAVKGMVFRNAGAYPLDARESGRQKRTRAAGPFHRDMERAMTSALADRGLTRGRIGADAIDARHWVRQAAPGAECRSAEDLMLHIRLVKTRREIALIRSAAQANVAAGYATARAARELGTLLRIRQRFFEEAAKHGNIGVYANVDLVVNEMADGTLEEGRGFMIDVVSHRGFYQGDFGRTVFMGEPNPAVRKAAQVGVSAWEQIRAALRPGLSFSAIHALGQDAVTGLGADYAYAFHPHSVGLQHWDHPLAGIDGKPTDLKLVEGMVLSVDCPLLNSGVGGTTHMEDLVLITADGCETLHATEESLITV